MATAKRTSSKKVVKKAAAKRSVARRPATKKAAAKKVAKRNVLRPLRGYRRNDDGVILIRDNLLPKKVVSPGRLTKGLSAAQGEIQKAIEEMIAVMTTDFSIHEIEFSASFNADGKFLGFGVGGEASIKVTIRPSDSSFYD